MPFPSPHRGWAQGLLSRLPAAMNQRGRDPRHPVLGLQVPGARMPWSPCSSASYPGSRGARNTASPPRLLEGKSVNKCALFCRTSPSKTELIATYLSWGRPYSKLQGGRVGPTCTCSRASGSAPCAACEAELPPGSTDGLETLRTRRGHLFPVTPPAARCCPGLPCKETLTPSLKPLATRWTAITRYKPELRQVQGTMHKDQAEGCTQQNQSEFLNGPQPGTDVMERVLEDGALQVPRSMERTDVRPGAGTSLRRKSSQAQA